jgi:hypothetical protein
MYSLQRATKKSIPATSSETIHTPPAQIKNTLCYNFEKIINSLY